MTYTNRQTQRLSKRQKRVLKQQGVIDDSGKIAKSGFNISTQIRPMTENQSIAFNTWDKGSHLMLHGMPGTGKTFIALYLALKDALDSDSSIKSVNIIRSAVTGRDQGFMPGSAAQKMRYFEGPYSTICSKLFNRGDAYEILKSKALLNFSSTSFLRGETFDDTIIIVDECQNMSDQELHTIMTRVGDNCKIIFSGDVKQDDLTSERKKEMSGLRSFLRILHNMNEFKFIEFGIDDIVRSDIVKSYIIERDRLGL